MAISHCSERTQIPRGNYSPLSGKRWAAGSIFNFVHGMIVNSTTSSTHHPLITARLGERPPLIKTFRFASRVAIMPRAFNAWFQSTVVGNHVILITYLLASPRQFLMTLYNERHGPFPFGSLWRARVQGNWMGTWIRVLIMGSKLSIGLGVMNINAHKVCTYTPSCDVVK